MLIQEINPQQKELTIIPDCPSSPVYNPNPSSSNPIRKKRTRRTPVPEMFQGTPTWISPIAKFSYNLILGQKMIFEEPVILKSLNCKVIEDLLNFNRLSGYLENIGQLRIYKSELAQFYANLKYKTVGVQLITTNVNGVYLILKADNIATWMNLPNDGVKLQNYKDLSELPFKCSWETLWNTLTHRYNPSSTDKILNSMLIPEASIFLKIITSNVYPQANDREEPSTMILVAIYCLLSKIKVNWPSLIMHNLATSTRNTGARHYPRMLSKLLGPGYFDIPLYPNPLIVHIQPFTASSFQKKWKNTYNPNSQDTNVFLNEEIIRIRHQVRMLEKGIGDLEEMVSITRQQLDVEREYNLELANLFHEFSSKVIPTMHHHN